MVDKSRGVDHQGKEIYVGIDVHKRTYTITVIAKHMAYPFKVGGIRADPDEFIEWLKNKFSGAKIYSAYEAGFSGYVLHRKLRAAGITNIVVNPGSIEVAISNQVKTDKRDSLKIAEHLFHSRLKGIHIPTKSQEQARQITRTRDQLTKKKVSIGNQIKSKLFFHGYIKHDDNRKMSRNYLENFVRQLNFPIDLRIAIDCLKAIYICIDDQIKVLNKQIAVQAKLDKETDEIYRSVPGIGPIWARTLANELGCMNHFTNAKKLFSYLGLTPTESSSGDKKIQGHISRQGRSIVRMVLCEASWVAIARDPALARTYHRIKLRRGGKRAIIAICRKLIGRIRCCLINRHHYLCGYGENDLKPLLKSEIKRTSVLKQIQNGS